MPVGASQPFALLLSSHVLTARKPTRASPEVPCHASAPAGFMKSRVAVQLLAVASSKLAITWSKPSSGLGEFRVPKGLPKVQGICDTRRYWSNTLVMTYQRVHKRPAARRRLEGIAGLRREAPTTRMGACGRALRVVAGAPLAALRSLDGRPVRLRDRALRGTHRRPLIRHYKCVRPLGPTSTSPKDSAVSPPDVRERSHWPAGCSTLAARR